MSPPSTRSRLNNFDLIRLIAALQVAIMHGVEHLGLRLPFHETAMSLLRWFPGVPIFFVISGFLIAASYERQALADFARNRFLRIFPALWVCLAVTIALLGASGYLLSAEIPLGTLLVWIAGQTTIVQFFNPDFLRGYGIGVVNGSLWTISVELQFYALTPFIVRLYRYSRTAFWTAMGVLVAANLLHGALAEGLFHRLMTVSFSPWLYMFMLGAALHFSWPQLRNAFVGKLPYWAAAYAVVIILSNQLAIGAHGNTILLPYVLVLAGLVMSAAYTVPHLTERLLRRNDISYGLYIYHMPIYNFVIYCGLGWTWSAVGLAAACAIVSWFLVERPVLSMKTRKAAPPPKAAV